MEDKGKAVIESKSMIEEIAGLSSSSSSRGGGGDVASSSSRGGRGDIASSSNNAERRLLFWTRDLDRHYFGNVSTAVMQANRKLTDYSQVELGRTSTYVGIYDGHGGYQAAAYVSRTMTRQLMGRIRDNSTMSIDNLRDAFLRTEASWLDEVDARFIDDPYIAGYGTCCLVGVFWKRNLYVANVGDSRAIIGRAHQDPAQINVHPLTRDDNVNDREVRAEVQALHPHEPNFVVEDENTAGLYLIKGRIQVSKSIGDAYLKIPRFSLDRYDGYQLNEPVRDDNPALSADPSTYTIPIEPQDRFVIFASNGLWDLLSNQQAANIVHQYPNEGIAERLITEGLTILAVEEGESYEDVIRRIHDDISVVVIFFDHTLQGAGDHTLQGAGEIQEEFPKYSIIQGSVSTEGESIFTALDELVELPHTLARLVYLGNLPYGSNLFTLYPFLPAVQGIEFGRHGFTCRVLFYEVYQAFEFVNLHRNSLVLLGKFCCVSYVWEDNYRSRFRKVDLSYRQQEVPFTVQVSHLAAGITVENIAWFFILNELPLRNFPIMHVRHNGELFAFVSFATVENRNAAMDLNGVELLGRPIRIRPSRAPRFLETDYTGPV